MTISEIIAKGPALTAADVREIEILLALMPFDEAHEKEPWIWEAVGRIVNDPEYMGDARLES